MKQLVPINDYGLFADKHDRALVDSRFVAKELGKRHDNILRDIEHILDWENSGHTKEFGLLNFELSSYINQQNKKQPCYVMTRSGFMALIMGYRGKKVAAIQEAYIDRFDQMEEFIKNLVSTRTNFPKLTDQIKLVNPDAKPYHYSNECDMINRIVLGMSAKQYREVHNIPKGESIRPYLAEDQVEMLNALQDIDYGLLLGVPDFQQRKRQLEWWAMTHSKQAIAE